MILTRALSIFGASMRTARPEHVGAAVSALSAGLLFLVATRHGIGVEPDTLRYMGLRETPGDAPFYAWLLKGAAALGFDMFAAAKAYGLVFAVVNAYLVWTVVIRSSRQIFWASIATSLVMMSPLYSFMHWDAMSEAPFLLFLMLSYLFAERHIRTGQASWLVAAGIAVGLGALTRFPGIATGAAIASAILLVPHRPFWQRFVRAVGFGLVAGGIFVAWVLWSVLASGQAGGRDLNLYGNPDTERWVNAALTFANLFWPEAVPPILRLGFLTLAAGAFTYAFLFSIRELRKSDEPARRIDLVTTLLFGLFVWFYIGFLVFAVFMEANLHISYRYTLPAYVAGILAVAAVAPAILERHRPWMMIALLVPIGLVLASHGARTALLLTTASHEGIGYARVAWAASPTIAAVKALPPDVAIFTNGPDAIIYLSGRHARFVPKRYNRRTGLPDPNNTYADQLDTLRAALARGRGYVVFLDVVNWRFYLMPEADIVRDLGLVLERDLADGRIYRSPE